MDKGARSEEARRTEEEILRKSGKAAEDPDKPADQRFKEMGERPKIRKLAGRGNNGEG